MRTKKYSRIRRFLNVTKGILAVLTVSPLAETKISVFAFSTFDTDYVLVKEPHLSQTKKVLSSAGFEF